jgi:hypothetical protein
MCVDGALQLPSRHDFVDVKGSIMMGTTASDIICLPVADVKVWCWHSVDSTSVVRQA